MVSEQAYLSQTDYFQVGKLLRGSRRRCLLIVDEEDGDDDVC